MNGCGFQFFSATAANLCDLSILSQYPFLFVSLLINEANEINEIKDQVHPGNPKLLENICTLNTKGIAFPVHFD